MSERLPAKSIGPVFIIGIARRILVGIADGESVLLVEVVVNLRVDLLSAVAGQSGSGRADGKNVFTAAVLPASPSKTGRVQSIAYLIVVGHRHLTHELRHKSRRINAGSILIPRTIYAQRTRRPDLNVRTV